MVYVYGFMATGLAIDSSDMNVLSRDLYLEGLIDRADAKIA